MLPENVVKILSVEEPFAPPRDGLYLPLLSMHVGGELLNISTSDLREYTWTAEYIEGEVVIYRNDLPNDKTIIITASGITSLSLAFDSSMRPTIAYCENDVFKLKFYDTALQQVVTTTFADLVSAQVVNDDPRPELSSFNDVIFAYTKNNNLYWRQQRDRYTIEYLAATDIGEGNILKRLGQTTGLRLQFEVGSLLPDYPGGCLTFPARAYNARVIKRDDGKYYLVWELENAVGAYINASSGGMTGVTQVSGMEYELAPYAAGTAVTFTVTPTNLINAPAFIRDDTTTFTF